MARQYRMGILQLREQSAIRIPNEAIGVGYTIAVLACKGLQTGLQTCAYRRALGARSTKLFGVKMALTVRELLPPEIRSSPGSLNLQQSRYDCDHCRMDSFLQRASNF